ncbi:hypothetical protein [Lysobacter sp. F6437]|uniref:hypothetical protein n=1 Tax=Lysobacter sp. F6437 TaxID=3459296 RepID=UPI00403DC5A9
MLRRMMMAGSSGLPPSGYTELNPADKNGAVALSGGNLVASAIGNNAGIARSVAPIVGKRYFEGALTSQGIGVGALAACGIATSLHVLSASLGYANAQGWAFWGNDVGARHNGVTAITQSAGENAVLGFAVDQAAGTLWIRDTNGDWMQGEPESGTSPIWSNLSGDLYAAACPWNTGSIITMRFDPATFKFAAPAGFSPITS